jgi:4-hydroxy-2-oxoheptanedioate aldolase
MPDADMGMVDTVEYMEHANRETFVCIQIEDAEALDNLDAIISVEGVDIIFVGPADLSLSLGIPLQFEDPKYVDAINRIAASVKKHGKYWGLPVKNVEAAEAFAAKGARLFNILSDYSLMRQGWTQVREDFDKTFPAG